MAAAAQISSPKFDKSNEVEDSKDFINKGLEKWEVGRKLWLATGASPNNNDPNKLSIERHEREGAINLNVDEIIDCIVSNRWRNAQKGGADKAMFPTSVPLPQMIDILVDLWEAEGLDA